jgi:hypothetical protein
MRITFIIIVSTIFCACESDNQEDLIKESFNSYKKAIINDDGKEAVKYVDSRTIKYYDKILELTKNADSVQIEKSTIMEKFFVLAIRHTTPKDSIFKFTGQTLYSYAIEKGMTGKEGAIQLYIDRIDVEDNFAIVEVKSKNAKSDPAIKINYYKENETWKADWTSFFILGNIAFKNLIKSSRLEENEFIIHTLNEVYGEQNIDVWKPLN